MIFLIKTKLWTLRVEKEISNFNKKIMKNFEMIKCGSIMVSLFHKKDSVSSTVYVFNHKNNVLHL